MHIITLLVAVAAAGVMGFANQRGGTCTVAAIEEIVANRRFNRLVALLEAALWVGAGILLLNVIHTLPLTPPGYVPGLWTIAGAILFGLGAFVNRACLFGTVARLGRGEWAYTATPLGLFAGSLLAFGGQWTTRLERAPEVLTASVFSALVAMILVTLRVASHGVTIRRSNRPILEHLWSPYVATTIIGLTFLATFITAGNWDYADFLTGLARGDTTGWKIKSVLAGALIAGAVLGGWSAGRIQPNLPSPVQVLRHFVGGMLMGAGVNMIPGGNTGLILLGMPMMWAYAWVAFVTICATIYVAVRLSRHSAKPPSAP